MHSQDMVPTSSQDSSQWTSHDTASMPSQDSTTNASTFGATGRTLTEAEMCLEGPTLRCTPAEERGLLDLLLNQALSLFSKVPLEYLAMLEKCSEQTPQT